MLARYVNVMLSPRVRLSVCLSQAGIETAEVIELIFGREFILGLSYTCLERQFRYLQKVRALPPNF